MSIARRLQATALAALMATTMPLASALGQGSVVERGGAIVARDCARCHAIGRAGPSPDRKAPPLRTLGRRYPLHFLAEALAEGITTGHNDMPQFVFEPDDIDAILAYLDAISDKGR